MIDLSYSMWHRTLGYSYFAMDVDYVEIRNNQPVAVIEASLCTPRYPNCDGPAGVFNRFLRETRGFQFEVAYWTAQWLNVPAYVICLDPNKNNPFENIHILSLKNGSSINTNLQGYYDFIKGLPYPSDFFTSEELKLPYLIEKLRERYPGMGFYPYFRNKQAWLNDYRLRRHQILERHIRERPQSNQSPDLPVKGETTQDRPVAYEKLRSQLNLPYVNINWVEWRKESKEQLIGRPAAIIKTNLLTNPTNFKDEAESLYNVFINSEEAGWWTIIAEKMLLKWYFVVYTVTNGRIGNRFYAWRSDRRSKIMDRKEYSEFIKSL